VTGKNEKKKHNLVRRIFAHTGRSYDFVVKAATLWQDNRWKRRILEIAELCENPERILDLACGTGILTLALAEQFPDSHVTGIDLQEEFIHYARAKKSEKALKNVEFHKNPAEDVKEGQYDLITASYLPKYVDLTVVIGNCAKILEKGGLLIFHDFTFPKNPIFRFFYHVYWTFLKPILWLIAWKKMSKELKRIITETNWIDEIQKTLKVHQFTDICVEVQKFEVAAIVYATKK
jgi:demethylmenaquinone methyltransferase/2-methoxy-6-polyprenyl-1,4-benzoquinol methylase